jgi:hypothetical protein
MSALGSYVNVPRPLTNSDYYAEPLTCQAGSSVSSTNNVVTSESVLNLALTCNALV